MSGAELTAAERRRQVEVERYTAEHDPGQRLGRSPGLVKAGALIAAAIDALGDGT